MLNYVYITTDHQAYGPFFTVEEAEYFIEGDKYLESWAILVDEDIIAKRYKNLVKELPEKYNPDWAKSFGA